MTGKGNRRVLYALALLTGAMLLSAALVLLQGSETRAQIVSQKTIGMLGQPGAGDTTE